MKSQHEPTWQLDILDLSGSDLAEYEVVDIREPSEDPSVRHLFVLLRTNVTNLPLSGFDMSNPRLDKSKKYLFICENGERSRLLVQVLRDFDLQNTFCVIGGVEALRRKFIA